MCGSTKSSSKIWDNINSNLKASERNRATIFFERNGRALSSRVESAPLATELHTHRSVKPHYELINVPVDALKHHHMTFLQTQF